MNIQRLRNLTTGRLHTQIDHVYEDLGPLIGEKGLMTHMLPRAMDAVEPWLRKHVTDAKFWDNEHDPSHVGDYPLPKPSEEDRVAMFALYQDLPNPLL